MKKKTISQEIIFANPHTFLCAGHDFGEKSMARKWHRYDFSPKLIYFTGFYFTYAPT